MTVRRALLLGLVVLLVPAGAFVWSWATFPSDRTPEGAYLRVVKAVNNGRPEEFFAYLETPAQHAAYTIRDYRKQSLRLVRERFPEPERARLAAQYEADARAADGADVFANYARQLHWLDRLRRDLSGAKQVEIHGERATVETARGTRYSFRRRENGIWGLTMFTATLVSEAEKAARDHRLIQTAAEDYARASAVPASAAPESRTQTP